MVSKPRSVLEQVPNKSIEQEKMTRFSSQRRKAKSNGAPYLMHVEFVHSRNFKQYLSARKLAIG